MLSDVAQPSGRSCQDPSSSRKRANTRWGADTSGQWRLSSPGPKPNPQSALLLLKSRRTLRRRTGSCEVARTTPRLSSWCSSAARNTPDCPDACSGRSLPPDQNLGRFDCPKVRRPAGSRCWWAGASCLSPPSYPPETDAPGPPNGSHPTLAHERNDAVAILQGLTGDQGRVLSLNIWTLAKACSLRKGHTG